MVREAARVARHRVIIYEDIVSEGDTAYELSDRFVNLELGKDPKNHSREEWLEIFARCGLITVYEESFESQLLGRKFPNHLFILDKVT